MVSIMLVVVFVHSPHNYVWVKVVKTFIDFLTSLVGKYYMRDQVPCNSSNTLLRCRPDQTRPDQTKPDYTRLDQTGPDQTTKWHYNH